MGDLISRQAAIDALCKRCDLVQDDNAPCMEKCNDIKILEKLPSAPQWIPLHHESEWETDFPYDHDGKWVIVTDGESISVERIKKDAYDHFFPNGRWFELEDVVAWMPLPKPYRKTEPFDKDINVRGKTEPQEREGE